MKYLIAPLLLFFTSILPYLGQAQAINYTISGQLTDGATGEDLPFTQVVVKEQPSLGTLSNVYGFYSLSIPAGNYTLQYQHIGFEVKEVTIKLDKNILRNVELLPSSEEIGEVVINAEKKDQNLTRTDGTTDVLKMEDVKQITVFGGEPDIVKVMELRPGIKPAGEGASGYFVRGGGIDQNLILLDEAPIYNPSHLLGFSVFNGDALTGATLYKGGMNAEYGGRTSSVLDVRMKEGNKKKFSGSGSIGLIAARLMLEGPIVKDKGSFMIAGRRTYADLFLRLSNDESLKGTILYFYDVNIKANYQVSKRDRLFVSGYFGRDAFGASESFSLNWGNAAATVRWNRIMKDKLFSNTTFTFSNYDYEFGFDDGADRLALQSVIQDFNIRQDFSWFLNDRNTIKIGANAINHKLEPGNISAGENLGIIADDADPQYSVEGAVYIQNTQKVGNRINLSYGLRLSGFMRRGEGTSFNFDENGETIGQQTFGKWEPMQLYGGLEPRFLGAYSINEVSSVKLGYNRNYQYLHLLSNATSAFPTDSWIMSSDNIKPQIADQVSLGYFRNFKDNAYQVSAEAYYKQMQNTIDYRNGANVFLNDELEGELLSGTGRSYGIEFLLEKKQGRLRGWISYTLSRTQRRYNEINNGDWFSARQDRIHDVALVLTYDVSKRVTISTNFIFYTGDAVTFPTGRYTINGTVVPYYTERNAYRLPNTHRLDASVTWKLKPTKRFQSSITFSLYNVYGRQNPFSISFEPSESDPAVTEAVQFSFFRWIPSITSNFNF